MLLGNSNSITKSSFRSFEFDNFKNERHYYKNSNTNLKSYSDDDNNDFNKVKNIIRIENKYENAFGDGKDENYEFMTYGQALKYDKRTFFRIYFSVLFSKVELVANFIFPEHYNVYSITIPFIFYVYYLILLLMLYYILMILFLKNMLMEEN